MCCPWAGQVVRLQEELSSHPVIEDLTHKTGNFKQFSIFCNMLESALTQVGTEVGVRRSPAPGSRDGSPLEVCRPLCFPFR